MTARRYVLGLSSDGLWLIGCPLVALGLMQGVWAWSGHSDALVYAVLTAFIVIGHHMPGWLRAFGEPSVYRANRVRLWVSFAIVPPLMLLPTVMGWGMHVVTVVAMFDIWHVARQQHGFGRIYAAKDGDVRPVSARVDLACVLVWYGTVVAWSDSWMYPIAVLLRRSGLPQLSALAPSAWLAIKLVLVGVSLGLALLYTWQAVEARRQTGRWALRKHLLHLVAFGVLAYTLQDPSWYRAQSVVNLFHALQYFFIVWAFSRLSIKRDPDRPALFYRAMFSSWTGLPLYAGAIALYGVAGWWLMTYAPRNPEQTVNTLAVQVMGSVALASLLLHFYVDSFIWRVRSRQVRRALDIGPDGEVALPPTTMPGVTRAVFHSVGYFAVPIALVVLLGRGGPAQQGPTIDVIRREAELFPRSALAHFRYGVEGQHAHQPGVARREFESALALAPSQDGPAWHLADLDEAEGRVEALVAHTRAAVHAVPDQAFVRMRYAWALVQVKRTDEAQAQMQIAIRQSPEAAEGYLNLARLFHATARPEESLPLLRKALSLEPDGAGVLRAVVGMLRGLGRHEEASRAIDAYLTRHPDDAEIRKLAPPR